LDDGTLLHLLTDFPRAVSLIRASTKGTLFFAFFVVGCVMNTPSTELPPELTPVSTLTKVHALAEAGDAESQNVVGFMLFFGEAAPQNQQAAHRWFHEAATHGHVAARLNLALMYYLGAGVDEDREEAERYFQLAVRRYPQVSEPNRVLPGTLTQLVDEACSGREAGVSVGETTYVTFCAGCHGLNGIAPYGGSPSFALGERQEKTDSELLRSIRGGHEVMPNWEDKLRPGDLANALSFLRALPREFQGGIVHTPRSPPPVYFVFGPMSPDFDSGVYQPPGGPVYEDLSGSARSLCTEG